ncbi:MAG: sialate O-acetylesterase, partial [Bacteroidota bacterium]
IFSALCLNSITAQVSNANRSGFTWITPNHSSDQSYGAGYSFYSAAWPVLRTYPGADNFQTGLSSSWMSTQRRGDEPDGFFYTTIEGGLGWWNDTRFGTATPKFIMGGVSHNFHSWANGPGAGQSDLINDGSRDWQIPGGKYGVAQLSPNLLWPPDGLNMAQGMNGELLGYGYFPLPLTEPMQQTNGQNIATGNQCWTLFFNADNFRGPATFFLPTFWTEPVLEDPSLEGLFLDVRPSDQEIGFGVELAETPALVANDDAGTPYAKVPPLQYPVSGENRSVLVDQIRVYKYDALWNDVVAWFDGGEVVPPGTKPGQDLVYGFHNDGGDFVGEIVKPGQDGEDFPVDLYQFMETYTMNDHTMGFEWNLDHVTKEGDNFLTPEYFKFENGERWVPISSTEVPASTTLLETEVPTSPRNDDLPYLTPLEADCHWQDPNGPWESPGPVAGPFYRKLGDGSTITYHWYRFVDQPAIVNANLTESQREVLQQRAELLHKHWTSDQEYLAPPSTGKLASIDPGLIVSPPEGMEIGYVPIVTRQEKSATKVKVFVLAGQSNMQGYGAVGETGNEPGSLLDVIAKDANGDWAMLGRENDWNVLENAWLYFDRPEGVLKSNVTVGQGAYSDLIGPELMFAHQLDELYEEPILIIKTAWGGKSLAVDFRPPSAGGQTGAYYTDMIETVQRVTQNLSTEFPTLNANEFEMAGFVWFQGWNDGESEEYMTEYESNLRHLVEDVRTDLGVADLPIVIASSGHGGFALSDDLWVRDIQTKILPAQESVGCDDQTYGGKLGYVDARPFYYESDESPEEAIHHFHNNARTFLNIGSAVGEEMKRAINDMAFCDPILSLSPVERQPLSIFPNPTSGNVSIQNKKQYIREVRLTDCLGRLIKIWPALHQPHVDIRIDGPPGVYTIAVEGIDRMITSHRIVKIGG